MSYKFDTMMAILRKLDAKEHITVYSLMNDLEVSERTVYRYLKTLEMAGYPIVFDKAKETYRFDAGYELGKPKITVEESLALSLSKKLLANFGIGMGKSLASIEEKLASKAGEMPEHIILKASTLPLIVQGYLGSIYHAVRNYQRIEIAYNALYTGEKTVRKIDPYYLFFQDEYWHLRGYCHLRSDWRTFALDRIASLNTLSEHFMPRRISPEDEVASAFGGVIDGDPVEITLEFDKHIVPYVLRKKWHATQRVTELENGRIEMRFTLNGLEGIRGWILRWLPHVSVKSPESLRKEVLSALKQAIKNI